jgi:hypothetical protein
MIGVLDSSKLDRTPRADGKVGGVPWTTITATDPETWSNVGDFVGTPATDMLVRISWDVRGTYAGQAPIISVGQAWVKNVDGDSFIVEAVETFTHARVRFAVDGSSTVVQIQSHATQSWLFQVRLAYDYEPVGS